MAIKDRQARGILAVLQRLRLNHGLSITSIVIVILLLWGIHWGRIVVPQIRQTADKVANINNLQKVDLKIGGCIPIKGVA